MSDWPREPLHPSEPSPQEVALILANPWNWLRLGLAVQWGSWLWVCGRLG